MERISAVVFDMFGTLTPFWPPDYGAEQRRACAQAIGIPDEVWDAALSDTFLERMTGSLGDLAASFREAARRGGRTPSPEQIDAAVRTRRSEYLRGHRVRPDALATLAGLREDGHRLALVSDCMQEIPDVWDSLDLAARFDATVFSCREGTRKPDPLLFRRAAQRLGVRPEACLYVGDGGGDELNGAAAVGMTPVMITDEGWSDHHAPHAPEDLWHGPAVGTLAEIPGLLKELKG